MVIEETIGKLGRAFNAPAYGILKIFEEREEARIRSIAEPFASGAIARIRERASHYYEKAGEE